MPTTPDTAARSAGAAETLPLPDPRHASRLPAGFGRSELHAIRQAAYALPQVVQPADYTDETGAPADALLDRLGLVLLQKAAGGARPSRWIPPGWIGPALAHIAAVGTGPGVRPQMVGRTGTLEGVGVQRRGSDWTRLVRQTLQLAEPGWTLPFLYRVPVPEEAVWAFYRDGDRDALLAALGPAPRHARAPELQAHVEALIDDSRRLAPKHLATLLPRLQAEGATPQSPEDLMTAWTRAQQRWTAQAREDDTLEGLNSELAFRGYPETFPKARKIGRRVTLFVGPPNSGKTHAAFERLASAASGAYLAPLRLLALEGRDRLVGRGVPCSLLTGEENVPAEGAHLVSSTIEMVNTQKPVEVAVIDEAQMIFDASRGWAWTQAIVAVPAEEVLIICSAYAVPAIQTLLGLCGEAVTLRRFERKQHVELLPQPVATEALTLGDAVVAFSRRDVLLLRDRIAANGHPVSVIYGALPPEVRRREAERFASGESHILVATDAIGMGLNLPIRRVLFSTLEKFDGQGDRMLDESEVHQIAGRAGRFGIHEEGFVGVLNDAEPTALRTLKELLPRTPRAPRDFKAPVAPNAWHVRTIAERLGRTRLRAVLGVFMAQLKLDDAHFQVAELEQMLDLAEQLDQQAGGLSLNERFIYAQAPVDVRTPTQVEAYLDWAWNHAHGGRAGRPAFLDEVDGHSRLERMEQGLRLCTLWLWLDLRFPGVYGHLEEVLVLRGALNDGIERQLRAKRPLALMRGGHLRGPRGGRRR